MKKQIQPVSVSWKPDKHSTVPLYEQIVQFICQKVSCGEWPVGTRLPPQRALAAMLGVNRSTIGTAVDLLTSYGVIEGRRGAGTQVASNTWSLLLPSQPDWSQYVSSGYFRSNSTVIQAINQLEFAPHMIRLGTGELDPRLFPAEDMRRVLHTVGSRMTSLSYAEPAGLPALRQAVASHMETIGIRTAPSCVLITSGALQALQLISASLLEGGSVVYTEAPTYLQSIQVFQSARLSLSGIPMDRAGLCVSALAARLPRSPSSVQAVLYTIPTNHNPTGITMSLARRRELLDVCAAHRLPVIEDGAYQDLSFGPPVATLKELDQGGTVIYLGSASKALAPGLRIGWLIAPEPIVQRLSDVKMQVDYGASSLSQLVMEEFLTSGLYDAYVCSLRKELRRRRDQALAVLERRFRHLASWQEPQGGFYIWLTLREPVHMEALFARAAAAGILINPGDIYDFRRNDSLRLSYAYTTPEEFRHGVQRLADIIETR